LKPLLDLDRVLFSLQVVRHFATTSTNLKKLVYALSVNPR